MMATGPWNMTKVTPWGRAARSPLKIFLDSLPRPTRRSKIAGSSMTNVLSVLVGADHFTKAASTQSPPRLEANGVFDELHMAVAEADVYATGVIAGGRGGAHGAHKREPSPEIVSSILAFRAVRRAGVEVVVNNDMPGVRCKPVRAASG
jgi:hypothetical protein